MLKVKLYIQITGLIVFIVGLVHLIRFFSGWVVEINGWTLPMWTSILGVLAAWYLAYNAWILSKKIKK
jgi:membrane-bound ClpP family serine protease